MEVESLSVSVPTDAMGESLAFWSVLLGPATFVDGGRWAQYDVGAHRLSLAGGDQRPDRLSILVRVTNLERALEEAQTAGIKYSEVATGPHERSSELVGPTDERVVVYETLVAMDVSK